MFWTPFKQRRWLQLIPGNVQPKKGRVKAGIAAMYTRRNPQIRFAGRRVPLPPSPISEITPKGGGAGGFRQKFANF
jgi:hypothetical protein